MRITHVRAAGFAPAPETCHFKFRAEADAAKPLSLSDVRTCAFISKGFGGAEVRGASGFHVLLLELVETA